MAVAFENLAPGYEARAIPEKELEPMTGVEVATFHPVRRKLSIDRSPIDADLNAWHDF